MQRAIAFVEQERRQIAQELHDVLGQELVALAFQSNALAAMLSAGTGECRLAIELNGTIKKLLTRIQAESWYLTPIVIKASEFRQSIYKCASYTSSRMGVCIDIRLDNSIVIDRDEIATTLYRIIQEAVINAIRHGHATVIAVRFSTVDGGLRLEVEDNGCGPDELNQPGMGMQIMQFRAAQAGGAVSMTRNANGGATIAFALEQTDVINL